jgi:hypothetical protein
MNLGYLFENQPIFQVIFPLLNILEITRLIKSSKKLNTILGSIIKDDIQVQISRSKIMIQYKDWKREMENQVIFSEGGLVNVYVVTREKRNNIEFQRGNASWSKEYFSLPLIVTQENKNKVKPQRESIDRTTSFLIPEDIIVLHVGKDLSFFLVRNQVNQIKDGEEHYNFVFGRNVYSREDVDIVLVKHKVDFLFEWGEKLDLFLQPQKIA